MTGSRPRKYAQRQGGSVSVDKLARAGGHDLHIARRKRTSTPTLCLTTAQSRIDNFAKETEAVATPLGPGAWRGAVKRQRVRAFPPAMCSTTAPARKVRQTFLRNRAASQQEPISRVLCAPPGPMRKRVLHAPANATGHLNPKTVWARL